MKDGKGTNSEKPPEDAEQFDLRSQSIAEDRARDLLRLFPEIRTEDSKVDFDRLRLALGDSVDAGKERYGIAWPGKADCFRTIQAPSLGTLLPAPRESLDWGATENLFIEGDNLEVLKLLQKAYLGKIKMIYIDPPYNTGDDLVYPDDFKESLETYLEFTGQVDSSGRRFSTNTETDGRFHSKWMSMMYPRLYLARNLLAEDGAIFVSIDDTEAHHLRELLDEIFGEDSFVGTFVWQSKKGGGSDKGGVVNDQEYVICYAKEGDGGSLSRVEVGGEELSRKDSKGPYRRGRELNKWGSNSRREDRPTMWFPIKGPDGADVYPIRNDGAEGCWRWGRRKMEAIVAQGDAEFVPRDDGTWVVHEKIRSTDPRFKPFRTWMPDVGSTADGTKEVKQLFDGKRVFDFPKPLSLLEHLLKIGTGGEDEIVLDFFAGSGTTAHALWLENLSCRGRRRFILVQLPEPTKEQSECYKAGYRTISQLCHDRLASASKAVRSRPSNRSLDAGDARADAGAEASSLDLGFRVFKLAESNFKIWDADLQKDAPTLQRHLSDHVHHIREGRTDDDILTEILLKSGFPLTTPCETLTLDGRKVYSVSHGALLICLDRQLTLATIRAMADRKPERVVCLDEGFAGNDQLKANAVQTFKTREVPSFKTV